MTQKFIVSGPYLTDLSSQESWMLDDVSESSSANMQTSGQSGVSGKYIYIYRDE